MISECRVLHGWDDYYFNYQIYLTSVIQISIFLRISQSILFENIKSNSIRKRKTKQKKNEEGNNKTIRYNHVKLCNIGHSFCSKIHGKVAFIA